MADDITALDDPPPGAQITADGWVQVLNRAQGPGRRAALFLDRDGVVVEEAHYLHRPEDVRLIAGAAELVAEANRRRVPVVLVTNQAGISRGKCDWSQFAAVQERLVDDLAQAGAFLNAVFACPHHGEGRPPYDVPDHPWRKPNPGMLLAAAQRLPVDRRTSWMVGDRAGDIAAAKEAGFAGAVHVATGHGADDGERDAARGFADGGFRVLPAADVAEARGLLPLLTA